MTSLFLLGARWDESPALVASLREEAGGDTTILSLDFWARRKLREASLAYQTPNEYLALSECQELDALAVRLAQTWYQSAGDRLNHNGISLGQVSEYDFIFLFIDALRSVEIARRVFDEREPKRVFLNPQSPRIPPSETPMGICYESLPAVVEDMAHRQNVPVTWTGNPAIRDEGGSPNDAAKPSGVARRRGDGVPELARRGFDAGRAWFQSWAARGQDTILFMRIPYSSPIAAAIKETGLHSLSLPPTRAGWMKARLRSVDFRGVWDSLRTDPGFRDALTYKQVRLSRVLAPRFRLVFERTLPRVAEYIEGAEWLIRRLRPRILVIPEDVSAISRAICQVFRRHGLPTLVIQHGAVSADMGGYHVMPVEADRQAVWGDLVRDWHLKRGKSADSQVVTGNPGFDPLTVGYEQGAGDLRRLLRLGPDVGIILVATNWFTGISSAATIEDEERFIRSVFTALRQLPAYRGVVKLHPNFQAEYERLVRAIAEEEGVHVAIARDRLWDLLALADLVIVTNSTVGVEAMLLGKPVVVVDLYEGVETIPYVARGAALGASRPDEIASVVAKILGEGKVREEMSRAQRTFVREYAYLQDGKASERVARLIESMVRAPGPLDGGPGGTRR